MSRRTAAVSSDALADAVANEVLAAGATALGACLSGFFAAAAASEGVLLSPVGILLGGVGIGGRGFDGRLRQPGLGAKRPRGFTDGESVPLAARVAIPCGIAAAAVACGYQTGTSLNSVVRPGLPIAKKSGSEARLAVLQRIREQGGNALKDPLLSRPLQLLGGPSEGGAVSIEDLSPRTDLDSPLAARQLSGTQHLELPWGDAPAAPLGVVCVVLAIDVHGGFAGMVFQRMEGPSLEGLDVVAPLGAVPVMRGVPRVRPGSPLPAPAPIALVMGPGGVDAIIAKPDAFRVDSEPSFGLRRNHTTRVVERFR